MSARSVVVKTAFNGLKITRKGVMNKDANNPFDLNQSEKAQFIVDMFTRMVVHFSFWLTEVRHQVGMDKALELLNIAGKRSIDIQMDRLSKVIGFEIKDGLPKALLDMDEAAQNKLMGAVAKNWLVNDGVWFQAVEFDSGMVDAKRCNDSCWAQFSPYEANAIKSFLNLPENPGLDGLKRALNFRLYSMINEQSVVDEDETSFQFQMDECRVQSARRRKKLNDYPCKSGGMVEYTYFARAIDSRIHTECVGCPPDEHPEDWYCAWRFSMIDTNNKR